MAQEAQTERRGNPTVFVLLTLAAIAGCIALLAGFWFDDDETTEYTPLQSDVSEVETGPGSEIPE